MTHPETNLNAERDAKGRFKKGNQVSPHARDSKEIMNKRNANVKFFFDVFAEENGTCKEGVRKLYKELFEHKRHDLLFKIVFRDMSVFDKTTETEELLKDFNLTTQEQHEKAELIIAEALAKIRDITP